VNARFLLAATFLLATTPAIACTPPPPDTRTLEQVEAEVRRQFDAARDLIDLRMVRTATERHNGVAVVTRSLKGSVRPGTRLRISTMDDAACGYGNAVRGQSYRMYLSSVPVAHFQPLEPKTAAILAQIGALPPDWR
jgi:hypothetical protein